MLPLLCNRKFRSSRNRRCCKVILIALSTKDFAFSIRVCKLSLQFEQACGCEFVPRIARISTSSSLNHIDTIHQLCEQEVSAMEQQAVCINRQLQHILPLLINQWWFVLSLYIRPCSNKSLRLIGPLTWQLPTGANSTTTAKRSHSQAKLGDNLETKAQSLLSLEPQQKRARRPSSLQPTVNENQEDGAVLDVED